MSIQQKEVIHLTFGSLPLHISTHFFNQQSSHFQYPSERSDEAHSSNDDLILDSDVDFQEGVGTRSGEGTYFPRQVVCAFREELGTRWGAYDVVLKEEDDEEENDMAQEYETLTSSEAPAEGLHAWGRPAEILHVDGRRKNIKRGSYQENEEDEEGEEGEEVWSSSESIKGETRSNSVSASKTFPNAKYRRRAPLTARQASSYAHNSFHPSSLRPLPRMHGSGALAPMGADVKEGFNPLESFEQGWALSKELEKDASFLDDSIRFFAEDSDLLQSFNLVSSSSDGFSGITHATLEMLQDEFPKTAVVAWGAESGDADESIYSDQTGDGRRLARLARLRKSNNALSLWSLASANVYIPLEPPDLSTQKESDRLAYSKRVDWNDNYSIGALYAAHLDTATLPTRVRLGREPASSMISRLNWRKDTPIAALFGCLPTPPLAPIIREAKQSMDPIEALLAARGYGSKPQGKRASMELSRRERAEQGASQLGAHSISLSGLSWLFKGKAGLTSRSHDFASHAVSRDYDRMAKEPIKDALECYLSQEEPLSQAEFVPLGYNVQSASFPQTVFERGRISSQGRYWPRRDKENEEKVKRRRKVESVPVTTTLSTTPLLARKIREAKSFVDSTLICGHLPLYAYGLGGARGMSVGAAASEENEGLLGGKDGLVEVRERLEELLGAYEVEGISQNDQGADEEGMGTDEEYEREDEEELEWDI